MRCLEAESEMFGGCNESREHVLGQSGLGQVDRQIQVVYCNFVLTFPFGKHLLTLKKQIGFVVKMFQARWLMAYIDFSS